MGNINITPEDKRSIRRFVNQKLAQIDQSRVGLTNIIKHEIPIRGDPKPWFEESHKNNPGILYQEIDRLINKGYITRGNRYSNWISQARVIKNKNGDWIFHVDYTQLNSCFSEWAYPIHSQWDILQNLYNARLISNIKLYEAFHQIELKPESRKYTSFEVSGRGVYMWVRMPYGLKGASASVCYVGDRIRETVTERIKLLHPNVHVNNKIFVCLETWIVISETPEEHEILLDCLLDVLYENGLEVDLGKSRFAKESIDYFGFTINYDGVHVCQNSIKPIIDFPRPQNIQEVRQFNSMVHRYRSHLENIAVIQRPLNKFCATQAVWRWTEEEEDSFKRTKEALLNASSLSMLNPNLPFRLYTYITCCGRGAKLVQYDQRTDSEYLITYISKIFNETEKTYPEIDRKVLSVEWAVPEVRCFIEGCDCEVYADPLAVLLCKNKRVLSRKSGRWAAVLSESNVTLKPYYDDDAYEKASSD